jgi:hypothetical protein
MKLNEMGYREQDIAREILNAYLDGNVSDNFRKFWNDCNTDIDFNSSSGYVFLINEDYQTALMNDDVLDIFLYTPYKGLEGFPDELRDMMFDGYVSHFDDIEFLYNYDIISDEEFEVISFLWNNDFDKLRLFKTRLNDVSIVLYKNNLVYDKIFSDLCMKMINKIYNFIN